MSDSPAPPQHFESDLDDPRTTAMVASMVAQGVNPEDRVAVDYFARGDDKQTFLPDGVSYFTHKTLMEGERKKYLKQIQRDLKIQKGSGDAIMKLAGGEDRAALLSVAITGWQLVRNGQPFPFNAKNLNIILEELPPKILELVERDVKKNNPWLLDEASAEDIKKEIEYLQERLVEAEEREAGKSASGS